MFRIVMATGLLVSMSILVVGCDGGASASKCCGCVKPGENPLPRIDPKKEKDCVSTDTDVTCMITIRNMTKSPISLHWLDETAGDRVHYENIPAGGEITQGTYEDHYWIILDKDSKALGIYKGQDKDGVIVIK